MDHNAGECRPCDDESRNNHVVVDGMMANNVETDPPESGKAGGFFLQNTSRSTSFAVKIETQEYLSTS